MPGSTGPGSFKLRASRSALAFLVLLLTVRAGALSEHADSADKPGSDSDPFASPVFQLLRPKLSAVAGGTTDPHDPNPFASREYAAFYHAVIARPATRKALLAAARRPSVIR